MKVCVCGHRADNHLAQQPAAANVCLNPGCVCVDFLESDDPGAPDTGDLAGRNFGLCR